MFTLGSINSLADESSEQTPPVSDTETAEGTSGEDFAEITPYVDGSGSFGTVSWDITGNTLTLYGGLHRLLTPLLPFHGTGIPI